MHVSLALVSFIEGLTEFLPISSTAHLILTAKVLHVDTADAFIQFFLIFIQLGALLAGIILFAKRIVTDKKLFVNLCASFVPTAIIGFALYKVFKKLLEGNMILIATVLLLGGIIFIYLEKFFMRRRGERSLEEFGKSDISITDAFVIGIAQAIAIIPGVSRSGATIIGGILRNIKKVVIIEYTFILAIPTLGAATLYDAYKNRALLESLSSYGDLAVGFIISFVVALITLLIMKKYLPRISLTAFGWYRIVLALVIFISFL